MTVKEQDQARSNEESLVAHRQLRLLVAELELLHPSMPCLQVLICHTQICTGHYLWLPTRY